MKLPTHIKLHLTEAQQHSFENIVDNGKAAMHLATRTLVSRASSTDSSSSSTCTAGNNSAECEKPQSPETLPIVLGAVIPIVCALVVFAFLHRRLVKKRRLEDANDPHRSLDFGDAGIPSKLNKNKIKHGVPEMTITDMEDPMRSGRVRGMSMDDSNPYLLPAGLQGSHGSIHSMSRSMQDQHDPYRPVTMMRTSTDSSRPRPDNASGYSASTNHSATEKANLLRNAQRMSKSNPVPRVDSMSPHTSKSSEELEMRQMHSNNRSIPPSRKTSLGSTEQLLVNVKETSPPPRKQSMPQSFPQPPPPAKAPLRETPRSRSSSRPARKSVASAGARSTMASVASETSNYGREPAMAPPIPALNEPTAPEYDIDPSMISTGRYSIDTPNPSQQFPVQPAPQPVMGLRPLPSDLPEDNPEVRANRIRSFYKEYFDDSRPNPATARYEEDANYMEGAIYDPETGAFVMAGKPYAEAPGRRAMTPPPRGAPRTSGPHRRQYSTQSAGRPQMRGRQGQGPPPPMPKKRMPPPKPLQGLPAPSKLGDYDSMLSSPIDYAPPTSFRQTRSGSVPDSPLGIQRVYSPSVRAFSPLVGAHDELVAIPSPHLLRKSGTFTTLDFAPPKMLGARGDGGSDSGSIRSARSGISAMQMDAVRAGAYRVSRIPKEMVTTRDDLAAQLRPKMDMGR